MHPIVYAARRRWYDFAGWPGEIRAAQPEDEGKAKPVMGEVGVTGLSASAGRITEEYNADLATMTDRMARYEEMRRSDSALAVMEALISLPIRAAHWRIVPGDDKALAERIEQNLFTEMTHSWDDLLRQALLSVLYGFTPHEKVFEKKADGFLGWRKFAERDRRTVYSWNFDSTGGLKGFHQRGKNPETGDWVDSDLPISKLIIWTWRGEAGNPEGLGAFRQAYKHYFYKTAFEEWAAIRIERQACGIPVSIAPPEATEDDVAAMLQTIKRIRTNETAGVSLPYGWELNGFDLGAADVPFGDHIEREHQYMLQSVLGQFVGYAQGGESGSFALSRDSSSIFLMSLNSTAKWVTECFNRYALTQLCYFNERNPGKVLPRLECGPVGVRDMDKFASAIRQIFGPNGVIPEDVEGYVREMMDLPEMQPGDYDKRVALLNPVSGAKQPALPGTEPDPVPAPAE